MTHFDLYLVFIAIYRAGSISGAAKIRSLTQPAVSQQLAALESIIGAPLFLRTPRGVRPTKRGQALYAQVFESIDRLEQVSRSIRRRALVDAPATLRLGCPADFFHAYVLDRLRDVPFQLQVSLGDAKDLLGQLETGGLDAAISTIKPTARTLQHRVLAPKTFRLVGPPDAELPPEGIGDDALAAWLNAQRWVSYSVDQPITRRFWQQHLGGRFSPSLAMVVPDLRAVLRAVELGYGMSILPDFLCGDAIEEGRVREIWPVAERIPSDQWVLAFREVDDDRPELATLAARLAAPQRDACAEPPAAG